MQIDTILIIKMLHTSMYSHHNPAIEPLHHNSKTIISLSLLKHDAFSQFWIFDYKCMMQWILYVESCELDAQMNTERPCSLTRIQQLFVHHAKRYCVHRQEVK
eukprot:780725_1